MSATPATRRARRNARCASTAAVRIAIRMKIPAARPDRTGRRPRTRENDMAVSANRLELLQSADAVAREKSIDRGIVIAAMEDAIAKAARSRYGSETEVRAEIDPKKGELRLSRLLLVADQVENSATQISVEDAKKRNPAAQVGDFIAEPLPPLEYG